MVLEDEVARGKVVLEEVEESTTPGGALSGLISVFSLLASSPAAAADWLVAAAAAAVVIGLAPEDAAPGDRDGNADTVAFL